MVARARFTRVPVPRAPCQDVLSIAPPARAIIQYAPGSYVCPGFKRTNLCHPCSALTL